MPTELGLPIRRPNEMKGEKGRRQVLCSSFDRAFFLGVGSEAERCGMSWIRLPDASAGEPGGKDELPGCIGVLGEFDFGAGLWKLLPRVITLGPDLVQEITAAHGVENQLGLGRGVEGRARLRQ